MRQTDHSRWCADRCFDEYAHGDRCSRAFFESSRQDRVDSTIREVRRGTRKATGTRAVLREARAFFSDDGGFFNNGARIYRADERRLLDALTRDGRTQPADRRADLALVP